jgi:dolichyl-phosphate beta-glucosyltransferase
VNPQGTQPRLDRPFLSVIIPAHNEEKRLPKTMEQVFAFQKEQRYTSEVLVVENASQDGTLQLVQNFITEHHLDQPNKNIKPMRVIQEPRRGKGWAVKRGMLEASGEYRFMCDADFSMPVTEVNRFIPPALTGVDIAIASRETPGSVRYDEPAYRHLVGRVFNALIRTIALPGLQDTQCGFKCFRGTVAEDLFNYQTISGWSFDVEVLFIARQRGYVIREISIPWYFNANSHISVVRDSLNMAFDLLKIRWNNLLKKYG